MTPRRALGCAVVAVLVGVGCVTALWFWARYQWLEMTCTNQLHTLGLAFSIYQQDCGGELPSRMEQFAYFVCHGPSWLDFDFVPSGPPIFRCPLDPNQRDLRVITNSILDADNSCRCSYDWRLAYAPIPDEPDGTEPLMWDIDGGDPQSSRANHRHGAESYGNLVYFDGHTRRVPSAKWPDANRPASDAEADARQFGRRPPVKPVPSVADPDSQPDRVPRPQKPGRKRKAE